MQDPSAATRWIAVMDLASLPEGGLKPVYPLGLNVVVARVDGATQKRIMAELDAHGANGFPFVRIGDTVTIGYNPARYKELLGL